MAASSALRFLTAIGHDPLLVAVGSLSKLTLFTNMNKADTAVEVFKLVADRLVCCHKLFEVVLPERDPRTRFNIQVAVTLTNHTQSNGRTKRVTRTLKHSLCA